MDIGKAIKDHREKQNMSMNELARRSGVAQSGISEMEAGRRQPTFDVLEKLINALNMTLNDFFTEDIPKIPPNINELIRSAKELTPEQIEAINQLMKTMNKTTSEIESIEEPDPDVLHNAYKSRSQYNFKKEIDKVAQMPYWYQRLKGLREEKGLTQEELCEQIEGLTLKILQDYESGHKEIDPYFQVMIPDYFDVSVSFLMGLVNVRKGVGANVNFEAASRETPIDSPFNKKEREAINKAKRSEGFYVEDD